MPLPPIICSKCGLENPVTVRFCKRCHTPTRYECPSCHHLQMQGGTCEKCGTDFAKYTAMLLMQMESRAKAEREAAGSNRSLFARVLLAPVTGVTAIYKALTSLRNGE